MMINKGVLIHISIPFTLLKSMSSHKKTLAHTQVASRIYSPLRLFLPEVIFSYTQVIIVNQRGEDTQPSHEK